MTQRLGFAAFSQILLGLALANLSGETASAQGCANGPQGCWDGPYDWTCSMNQGYTQRPEISHAALIPHGPYRGWILMWHSPPEQEPMQSVLWNPAEPTRVYPLKQVIKWDLFCSGATWDPEGQLVVAGGNVTPVQIPTSSFRFFPTSLGGLSSAVPTYCPSVTGNEIDGNPWQIVGSISIPRYYPTAMTLAAEDILNSPPLLPIEGGATMLFGGAPDFATPNPVNANEFWQALSPGAPDWTQTLKPASNGIGSSGFIPAGNTQEYACLPTTTPPQVLLEWYPRAIQIPRSFDTNGVLRSVKNIVIANDVSGHKPSVSLPANATGSTWIVKPPYLSAQGLGVSSWQMHRAFSSNTSVTPDGDRYYGNLGFWILRIGDIVVPRILAFNGQHVCSYVATDPCAYQKCLTRSVQEFVVNGDPADTTTSQWIDKDHADGSLPVDQGLRVPRVHASLVITPLGQALILGGEKRSTAVGAEPCDVVPANEPEQYEIGQSPLDLGVSSLLATSPPQGPNLPPYPRGYHSLGVLLQDGRVLLAGGTNDSGLGDSRFTAEIFSPPYLRYSWARPTIRAGAAEAVFGQTFQITVQHDGGVVLDKVVLLRPASVTHHFDVDQRYIELKLELAQGLPAVPPITVQRLTLRAPETDVAPPGYYMLWVVDKNSSATNERAPSAAHYIRIHE